MKESIFTKFWLAVFDDDPPPSDPPPSDPPPSDKTFTQDQLNKILADDRRRHEAKIRQVLEEADALKAKASLTDEERTDLENRLESMRNDLLTKEELAKKEKDKLAKKFAEDTQKLTADRDAWQQRFTRQTIERTIIDASIENEAFVPEQIVAMLRTDTKLEEALDEDGRPTGQYLPKVTFADTDKDGKPVTLSLSVKEAVKRMTEIPKYGNLFKGKGTGGLGNQNTGSGSRHQDAATLAKDPAAYRAARKEGRI